MNQHAGDGPRQEERGTTKAEIRREMAESKAIVYGMWIKGQRGNVETAEQRAERHALTDRGYELRRQLRAL